MNTQPAAQPLKINKAALIILREVPAAGAEFGLDAVAVRERAGLPNHGMVLPTVRKVLREAAAHNLITVDRFGRYTRTEHGDRAVAWAEQNR